MPGRMIVVVSRFKYDNFDFDKNLEIPVNNESYLSRKISNMSCPLSASYYPTGGRVFVYGQGAIIIITNALL